MTKYDYLIPISTKLIKGLAAKPGVRITDKTMAADWLAQAINGMIERNELPNKGSNENNSPVQNK